MATKAVQSNQFVMSQTKNFPLIARSKNAALKQPKELISYSRGIDGSYTIDDSGLCYYYLPDSDVGLGAVDLAEGIASFKLIDDAQDGLFTGYLLSIIQYEKSTGKKIDVDIITWRGIMTKLLTLPYENRDPFVLKVVKFDGQIFMQIDKSGNAQHGFESDPNYKKAVFGGYKFEAVATLNKPWPLETRDEIENRSKLVVNNFEQYSSVVKTGIGKVKYLIAGEVDCTWDYKPNKLEQDEGDDPLSHYVELKTSKVISTPPQLLTFEKKLYKTWAQCFLLGIRKIIYGFRDENMILRSVEEFKTDEIPVLIKNNPANQQVDKKVKNKFMDSIKFFSAVLDFIHETTNLDETNKLWTLSFNPNLNKDYLNLTPLELDKQQLEIDNLLTNEFQDWRLNQLPNL